MDKLTYYRNKLEPVVNGTIIDIGLDEQGQLESDWIGIEISFPAGKRYVLWLLADEEGNSPGSFDVIEVENN